MKTREHYLNQPEGQTYEKKSGRIDPKALAITMVAMANADGGTIAVGIENDGTISGIDEMTESIFRQDDLCSGHLWLPINMYQKLHQKLHRLSCLIESPPY